MRRRPLLALLALLALGGCALPLGDGRTGDFSRRKVWQKREPQELVADDGTRCWTTRERYLKTKVGDHLWCIWSERSARGDEIN